MGVHLGYIVSRSNAKMLSAHDVTKNSVLTYSNMAKPILTSWPLRKSSLSANTGH